MIGRSSAIPGSAASAADVIQSATVLVATPFVIVLIAICVHLVRELRHEPCTSTPDLQVRRAVIAHLHEDLHANGLPTTHTAPR